MIERNYYHFTSLNNYSDDFILSQNVSISKDTAKFLKNFQLSAIKFLYKNFQTHKACILNDESGLGKTASVSVFLNVILANNHDKRKCLIICKNEERIINWKFHLDILTDLSYKVVFNENEIDDHIVYLTKWESLRSSASLANYKFDCIIVDNRDNLMSNKICLAYLLRNYENKISLVIANQDVTIDLKELHSVLRLCRRLEPKYRDFNIFEDKFELPLVQGCSSDNQKILESYFLRREKILNYCKEFCLRRFRHQYENQLPLVPSNVYRLNIKKWQDAPLIAKIKPVQLNIFPNNQRIFSFDRDTEDLHNSYINKGNQEENAEDLINSYFSRKEEDELNNEICRITTTITDNAVEQSTEVMSPLVFIPDDSDELVDDQNDNIIDNIVSSTTKDENDVRIIHPTPIHIYSKPEFVIKNNQKQISEEKDETESEDEPELIRVTRLTSRSKKDKNCKSGYKKLTISRISTRGQDRVTRSQAHKNKYLTLSIENTIEKSKRDLDEIAKIKKKNCQSKDSENKLVKKNIKAKPKTNLEKRKKNLKRTNKCNRIISSSESESNPSSYRNLFNESLEPARSSCESNAPVNEYEKMKEKLNQSEVQLTGLSLLEVQQSDTVHVIESTPELIVLSSTSDSSNFSNKNSKNKFTKQNKTVTSPDIFGSTIDDSLNILCSQKSKHLSKTNRNPYYNELNMKKSKITFSVFDVLDKRLQTPNTKNDCLIDCEKNNSTEKINIRNRSNSTNITQNNKITKYLKKDSVPDSDKEIVSSSSQSTIQSSPLLVYPKTPRKKKIKNIRNESTDGSSTKPSPHSRNTSLVVTPTKTPTTLTKWLLKSNINLQNNEKNEEVQVTSSRATRSLIINKRRRLDMSFKD